MQKDNSEKQFLTELEKLAFSRSNDAVKLAFLGEDALKNIGKLDLSALTEFHRLSNGTVEMKFIDRVKLLELLQSALHSAQDAGRTELVSAISRAAERLTLREEENADDLP